MGYVHGGICDVVLWNKCCCIVGCVLLHCGMRSVALWDMLTVDAGGG